MNEPWNSNKEARKFIPNPLEVSPIFKQIIKRIYLSSNARRNNDLVCSSKYSQKPSKEAKSKINYDIKQTDISIKFRVFSKEEGTVLICRRAGHPS